MRIAGQVLAEETAAPLGGVTVRVARRGAGNALLSLMTNTRGEFESELSDDLLSEPVLVVTATRQGYVEVRLERAPSAEMNVALGLKLVEERRPPPPSAPLPVEPRPGVLGKILPRLLAAAVLLFVRAVAELVYVSTSGAHYQPDAGNLRIYLRPIKLDLFFEHILWMNVALSIGLLAALALVLIGWERWRGQASGPP